MTALRTTFDNIARGNLQAVWHPTDRELAAIHSAIDDGTLSAVIVENTTGGIAGGEMVAIATPDAAQRFTDAADREWADAVKRDLSTAARELRNLEIIIGEVLAESDPADHRVRLDDALYDVEKALDAALDNAKEL